MPSIFSKNAVISGDIDYYCLVCDDKLKTEDIVNSHIQKAIHKKNLDQKSSYVRNYENDNIRKVNKGYYCEYCNILLMNSLKISFHVKLKSHEYNKLDDVDVTSVNRHAKRYENGVIIFDHILVTEKAWNGLIDNNCAYCNIEFNNEELHKTDSNHILNLIQTQLLVGEKRSVYRKIDNNSFHCITCNEVLPLPIESHFDQDSHVDRYIQCRRDKKDLYDNTQKNPSRIETPKKQLPKESLPQKQELKEPQVGHFSESSSANKKFEDIKVNKAKVPGRTTETDSHRDPELDPLEELVKKLNLKDYIYVNEKGEPLCMLCEWELSVSNYSVDEHIQGRHHQEILKLHKKRVERGNKNRSSYGNQVQTKPQMKNDVTGTTVKENYSKSENTNTSTEHDIEISNASVESTDKSDILNNVVDLQKQAIAIDFIYEKALCKRCNECLPFQMDEIRNHIGKHSNNTKSKDNSNSGKSFDLSSISSSSENGTKLFTRPVFKPKNEDEPEMSNVAATNTITETNNSEKSGKDTDVKFASENGINYYFTSTQSYCRICKTQVPNSLSAMKEHVKGARHTRNIPEINVNIIRPVVPQKPYETETLKDFLKFAGKIDNRFQELIMINKKFCIDPLSFHIINKNAGRMRCHMCEKNFNVCDVNRHLVFDNHDSRLYNTPVIISEETEFIRIPRNDIFHCGFCNLILAGWNNMQDHMKSSSHRNNKLKSDWALEEFLPGLETHEIRDALIQMAIMRAFFNNL